MIEKICVVTIGASRSIGAGVTTATLAFICFLALGGCKREPPAVAATPPPVVMVSLPVEQKITDYYEYTGRTAAVKAVEVRARVSGYLVEVNFREGAVVKASPAMANLLECVPPKARPMAQAVSLRRREDFRTRSPSP